MFRLDKLTRYENKKRFRLIEDTSLLLAKGS